jgi:formylmethanofuran dehydrogenase subunit A
MLKITGGRVYDPVHSVDGEVRDIWVDGGRIIAEPPLEQQAGVRTLRAEGCVVMAGGIDVHAHIAGSKVNLGRKLVPNYHRRARPMLHAPMQGMRGAMASTIPSTFATGYLYAGMGYTMAVDAAIAPLAARHAHEEFADTPCIDKTMFLTMGNNHFLLERIADGNLAAARDYVAWLLGAAKGGAVKLVNPGGVEAWKFRGNVHGLSEAVAPYGVTPAQIITTLARLVGELGLPHPVHIHCNNLGLPGNWTTTLETMKLLDGQRGHITHVQFHSYGGTDYADMDSKVRELAAYVNSHPNLTVDVGQVMFGQSLTMTADGPWQYLLYQLTGNRWVNEDVEAETGCGVVPYEYKDKSLVNSWQWAIGMEWFLTVDDPWRIFLTTDHPNGAAFVSYPQIIALLMDRERRREALAKVHPTVAAQSGLKELDREYSLSEIAIITRAGPARSLGLTAKGHLGPGADADITVYTEQNDIEAMFASPRWVLKGGEVIVEDGHLRQVAEGRTLYVQPAYDAAVEPLIRRHFEDRYSVQFENYPVDEEVLPQREVIPCKSPVLK